MDLPSGLDPRHQSLASVLDWFGGVPTEVLGNAAGLIIGALALKLFVALTNRRIWSLRDETRVVLYVAESARTVVTKERAPASGNDGEKVKYVRSATGVGQVRALAALAPSLRAAYRKIDLAKVRMASEGMAGDQRCDLISLGGIKNNRVTNAVQAELERRYVLHGTSQNDWLAWRADDGTERHYSAEGSVEERRDDDGTLVEDREVSRDYGLVIKAPNPWNPKTSVIVFAGSSTFGTTAAAQFFVEQRRWRRPRHFEALVEVSVRNGHVGDPECLEFEELRRKA